MSQDLCEKLATVLHSWEIVQAVPLGKSARTTWPVVTFLPLWITAKAGPCPLFFGKYDDAFSCSAIRSTGEPFLNPRSDLSKLSSEPLLETDDDVLLPERLDFALPSPALGW